MSITICFSQSLLLDQHLYFTNDDSIALNNFIYPKANYIFLFSDDINNLPSDFKEFISEQEVQLVLISPHTPLDNIESNLSNAIIHPNIIHAQISAFQAISAEGFKIYFIKDGNLESSFTLNDFENQIITHFKENYRSILNGFLVECNLDNSDCLDLEYLTYSDNQIEIDNVVYTTIKQDNENYLVREDTSKGRLYLYSREDRIEHLLFDFNASICDTLNLYSILKDDYVQVIITDQWIENSQNHILTNIPQFCDGDRFFELIDGVGSNGGLLPLYDMNYQYSALQCQWNDGIQSYGSNSDCDQEKPLKSGTSLYPNPTVDNLTIDAWYEEVTLISIHDIRGRQLAMPPQNENTINVNHLPAGVYLIRASISGILQTFKFVKD